MQPNEAWESEERLYILEVFKLLGRESEIGNDEKRDLSRDLVFSWLDYCLCIMLGIGIPWTWLGFSKTQTFLSLWPSSSPPVNCGVLAIGGHSGPLVNWFSAFSDEPSLKVAKLLYRREICLLRNQSVQIGQSFARW
jgi:hypothetical protein